MAARGARYAPLSGASAVDARRRSRCTAALTAVAGCLVLLSWCVASSDLLAALLAATQQPDESSAPPPPSPSPPPPMPLTPVPPARDTAVERINARFASGGPSNNLTVSLRFG